MFSLFYQYNTIGDRCFLKMNRPANNKSKMFGYPRLAPNVCTDETIKNNIDNCCVQPKNALLRVRPSSTNLKKNYYTNTDEYLYNRCHTFEQQQFNYLSDGNASVKPGAPLSQTNTYKSNCVHNLVIDYDNLQHPIISTTICETVQYNPNNYKFGNQGAVSSSDHILRLNEETITKNRATVSQHAKSKYFPNASGNIPHPCCKTQS